MPVTAWPPPWVPSSAPSASTEQHPGYFIKQMADFRNGERWHEYGEQLCEETEPAKLEAMFGCILHLNLSAP